MQAEVVNVAVGYEKANGEKSSYRSTAQAVVLLVVTAHQ